MASVRATRVIRAIAIAFLLTLPAGGLPATGMGAEPAAAWSSPVRVLTGTFGDVSATIDSHGFGHVVAVGAGGVWYATDRSGGWSGKRILKHRTGARYVHVSLALDAADRLHVAVAEAFPSKFGDLPGRIWILTDRGRPHGSFSTRHALTPSSSTDPSLKVPGSHTYLAWTGDVCFDVCEGPSSRVRYQTDGPHGWIRTRLPYDASDPDLRVDAHGKPRIVYAAHGATKERVVYARGSLRTGAFTTEIVARQSGWVAPRLVLDSHDRPLVAWTLDPFGDGPDTVFYGRRSAGGDWVTRSIGNGSVVAISVDAADVAHLAIGGDAGLREVLVKSPLVTRTIDATAEVLDVDLRVPATGQALVAYARTAPLAGVYVARR